MTELPLVDLSDLRSPSPAAQERVAERVDAALRTHGALVGIGHGIPLRIPRRGFALARLLFGLPASTIDSLRAAASGPAGGRGFTAGSTDAADGAPSDRFVLGTDLPLAHPLVAAGHRGYGPNRWPPISGFRDTITAWQRAALDVSELIYAALSLAVDRPADHLVAHHRCPLVTMSLDRHERRSAVPTAVVPFADQAGTGGVALTMTAQRLTYLHAAPGALPAVEGDLEAGQLLVGAGRLLEGRSDGRYRPARHRWRLGPAPALTMTLTNDLDHDTPADCLSGTDGRRRQPVSW